MAILSGERPTVPSPTAPSHVPADPETADRSTAWIWLAASVTTAWRRRVGLGVPTREQNVCPWEALDGCVAETWTRVVFREHGCVGEDEGSAAGISRLRRCGRRP